MNRAGLISKGILALGLAALLATAAHGAGADAIFHRALELPVGSHPEAVAIGDVTGDGRSDVVMTTSFDSKANQDYRLWVFVQKARGGLSRPISYRTTAGYNTRPLSVAIGDVTGDGKADAVVGIVGVGLQIFQQLPSGSLGAPATVAGQDIGTIRLGNLNGDKLLDVAAIGRLGTVTALINLGGGTFRTSLQSSFSLQDGRSLDLEVADVTGDGLTDVVVLGGLSFGVFPQLSSGGFGRGVVYPFGTHVRSNSSIGVGDVTHDGRNDVVVTRGIDRASSVIAVFTQLPSGSLAAPLTYKARQSPQSVALADTDRDGRQDVLTLHYNAIGVYRQRADNTLGAEELYALPPANWFNAQGLAVADVSADRWPDAVLAVSTMTAGHKSGLVVFRNRLGEPKCVVPQLVGLRLQRAVKRAKRVHCRVGRVAYRLAAAAKRNRVLSQMPRAGARRASGARINVIVGRTEHR